MKAIVTLLAAACLAPTGAALAQQIPVPVGGKASIYRDLDGIVHILANTERDLLYAQGWAHARDRFFQMDSLRRQASGTLGELFGPQAIGDDILLRTLGLRRAAERSLGAISEQSLAGLSWYAEGVNAWLAANPLPPEYAALEISNVAPWQPLDSVTIAKLLAFGLSFDLDVDLTQQLVAYQTVGGGAGFDGQALFFEDLYRTAPFDPAATVPDALGLDSVGKPAVIDGPVTRNMDSGYLNPALLGQVSDFASRLKQVPFVGSSQARREGIVGSNEWGVSGAHTANGRPMIANDPHLSLDTPATFYQNHLYAPAAGYDVIGSSFTGVPLVILGHNSRITWGATTNPMDVTDTFQEQLVPDATSAIGFGTVTDGVVEPLDLLFLSFAVNTPGDGTLDNLVPAGGDAPPFALIVPKRNNGPIVSIDFGSLSAISIQYTGFGATREVDAFRAWNLGHNLDDFVDGLQYFDFGSQNWAYADIDGNIAYFTSGELPLREDLQAGAVNGLPPFFIRDGTGGNEWLPVVDPEAAQATPSAVLPFAEMPQVVNPPLGFFVNANNDPAGTSLDNNPLNDLRPGGGIYYLNPGYATGERAGRITQALTDAMNAGPVGSADMAAIQANVRLLDAEFFTPYIVAAFGNAQSTSEPELAALAADPRIAEAAGRLAAWDYSTPTGVIEGYDASDPGGIRLPPDTAEIDASIAATLYSVWRGQFIRNTIDATLAPLGLSPPGSAQSMTALKNLVVRLPAAGGVGASGVDFFATPGVASATDRLDIRILSSLIDAVDRLAGDAFTAAFGGSTDQQDYRWGRLHRIVLEHPLGEPYNLPGLTGALQPSFADLPGFAVDGGFGAVDASSHSARADNSSAFMFGSGPVRRYVGQPGSSPGSIVAQTILPGGSSGVPGNPWYANLMERWLTNDTYPVRQSKLDMKPAMVELTVLSTVTREQQQVK